MSQQIEMAKRWTKDSQGRLMTALKYVPYDKLNWSPSPTSKSALKIGAHVGASLHGMAQGLSSDGSAASISLDQLMAMMSAEEAKITSRETLNGMLASGFEAVLSALDKIKPEQIGTTAQTPFGPIPMESFILLPSLHSDCHASQIDYLQTTWGDMEMPMS